jgi:O-acetyl-ADP-ribose deacetylase (regulator of RNase III)
MKNKKVEPPGSEKERVLDALLGSDDDFLNEGDADEYLTAAGIDPSALVSEFKSRLEKEAGKLDEGDKIAARSINAALRSIESQTVSSERAHAAAPAIRHKRSAQVNQPAPLWTNPSVLALTSDRDPVEVITQKARSVILDFIEAGWSVPPLDPFALADHLKIAVVPREDIRDARTVHAGGGKLRIEFNPNRPRGRVRYSISHEITHTLFPDCKEQVRNRATHEEMKADEWQLEMLCNVGAAELLMPVGSFPDLQEQTLSIDHLMELRKEYDVSTEALLLRIGRLTLDQCIIFSASRREENAGRYQIDYAIYSKTLATHKLQGLLLPTDSVVAECTAIGYTAKGHEVWQQSLGDLKIECVGIPPYPNQPYPRVMGIAVPSKREARVVNRINYLRGDATKPRGAGQRIIAHVVNDWTANWGGRGFASFVRHKWPAVQQDFINWATARRGNLSLGKIHLTEIDESTTIIHMICQRGYGESRKPRIRYAALRACLDQVADIASARGASVHMPRIGTGQAGGAWNIINELIEDALCRRGLKVTVYDLPNAEVKEDPQPTLGFS